MSIYLYTNGLNVSDNGYYFNKPLLGHLLVFVGLCWLRMCLGRTTQKRPSAWTL